MPTQRQPLAIGQTIYRYLNPKVFQYKVIGIRTYQDGEIYEVECQSCEHSYKCRCLVSIDNENKIRHIDFINNNEDDDQRHWHNDQTPYLRTSEEINRFIGRQLLDVVNETIRSLEKQLEDANTRKVKYIALVDIGEAK